MTNDSHSCFVFDKKWYYKTTVQGKEKFEVKLFQHLALSHSSLSWGEISIWLEITSTFVSDVQCMFRQWYKITKLDPINTSVVYTSLLEALVYQRESLLHKKKILFFSLRLIYGLIQILF